MRIPREYSKEEDVSGKAGIGGRGGEDLGIDTKMGDLHGGRPGPAAEAEGSARLKAGLRG